MNELKLFNNRWCKHERIKVALAHGAANTVHREDEWWGCPGRC
jgi:hypothetical protein